MGDIKPLEIADAVLERYRSLEIKEPDSANWTVIAGIVAEDTRSKQLRVVSVASGCKCPGAIVGKEDILKNNADIIKDSHAEVLARRGFIAAILEDKGLLRSDVRFHMFSSSPPCGDASIYEELDGSLRFTGAKLGDWRRESTEQVLGKTRTKPSRSDSIYRSASLSCTDKMIIWSLLGIQGAFIKTKITLSSLIVAAPHPKLIHSLRAALFRGILDRTHTFANEFCIPPPDLSIHVIANHYSGPAHCTKTKPSHLATAWWLSSYSSVERIVAHTGRLLGARSDSTKHSRLSTNALFELSDSQYQTRSEAKINSQYSILRRRLASRLIADFPADHPRKRRLLAHHFANNDIDESVDMRGALPLAKRSKLSPLPAYLLCSLC
uniref:tRNA-specific adenosine deaminase 1 n=1 Tax=Aureoumbra lagunensis TaxID=44058 RepID=A0A6S8ALM0_9STRA|mmetsp:Transcript_3072/g.4272  ORF Transcript_3072/g.4272 Transcript_3072/m.4272 type:complete len:381 (-) Transcript_3072:10-1152(-)